MRFSVLTRAVFLLTLLAPAVPLHAQGTLREPLEKFFGPAGAVFSPDGRTLFITNSARTNYGMVAGRGAISRVTVGGDGELAVDQQRMVDGLNGPTGVTILPARLGVFEAGTLVVAAGGRWVMRDRSTPIPEPRERETGLLFFDPKTGARLGAAYLGAGSALETILGHALLDPNHVVFDRAGTVFISDVAGAGTKQDAANREPSGIYRLTAAALEAIVRGDAPAPADVSFFNVPEVPGGIAWSGGDQRLYVATGTGIGDLVGAVLAVGGGDFSPGGQIRTVDKDLQPMMGACLTAAGSLVVAHTDGTLGVIKRGRGRVKQIRFRERPIFLSPGQPAATALEDGRTLVVVPEMAAGGRPAWNHRLQVLTLPADF